MKINWKIRFQNPVFWLQIGTAVLLPILAYFGMTLDKLTSWEILLDTLLNAISNPYVIGLALFSGWNAVNDPTTKGFSDSERALKYNSAAS